MNELDFEQDAVEEVVCLANAVKLETFIAGILLTIFSETFQFNFFD